MLRGVGRGAGEVGGNGRSRHRHRGQLRSGGTLGGELELNDGPEQSDKTSDNILRP